MKKYWLLFILSVAVSCKTTQDITPKGTENTGSYEPVSKGEVIKQMYYILAFFEENEQASWVYYVLTPEEINGTQSRTDDFRADPSVSTGSASLNDYKGSGYDRIAVRLKRHNMLLNNYLNG